MPTSHRCPSAWQPNPGRGSTYRRGKTVQTTGSSSPRHVATVAFGSVREGWNQVRFLTRLAMQPLAARKCWERVIRNRHRLVASNLISQMYFRPYAALARCPFLIRNRWRLAQCGHFNSSFKSWTPERLSRFVLIPLSIARPVFGQMNTRLSMFASGKSSPDLRAIVLMIG
jgi:hypothetical protein